LSLHEIVRIEYRAKYSKVGIMSDQGSLSEPKNWIVSTDHNGIRLDAFVRQMVAHLSRREVEKAIDEKLFMLNGRPGRKGERLTGGNTVSFVGPERWLSKRPLPNSQLRVPIVYEDSHLLIVDKPAGMETHGFSGRETATLANFIAAQRREILNIGKNRWEPGLVHRLDRETSGVLLIAKTQNAFEHLRFQFRRRTIKKTYLALVWGITEKERTITYPLVHDSRDSRRMRALLEPTTSARPRRWKALTRFWRLNATKELSLLEIDMETGVTHQIRVHLAAIGHPIVGDALYGAEHPEALGLRRQFLHACAIEFQHPADGRRVKKEAWLPKELQAVLKFLQMSY
jgi:23S rRNA pseudouridine1911/1915/1917 synthase